MGQIVIDIPSNKKRRYVVTDSKQAETLLSTLDSSAVRVKANSAKLSRQQLQDLRDGRAADRAMDDMRRTGVSYTVEDLRKKYGLA